MAEIFALIAVFAATVYFWCFVVGRLVWTALRTGRFLGRGVVYDRTTEPKRFWAIVVASIAVGVVMAFATVTLFGGLARKYFG